MGRERVRGRSGREREEGGVLLSPVANIT